MPIAVGRSGQSPPYTTQHDLAPSRRVRADRSAPPFAEETTNGYLLNRRQDNRKTVGLTVVGWWKRLGTGKLPDSIRQLEQAIEPWAKKLAA